MKIPELRKDLKILHAIGLSFEESGLCSLDTLKALKKEAFQVEAELEVFKWFKLNLKKVNQFWNCCRYKIGVLFRAQLGASM